MKRVTAAFLVLLLSTVAIYAESLKSTANTPAATPPMGWNSWNLFGCKVSDAVIRAQADAIASNSMREAGYTYINIDDCWQGKRGPDGVLQPNERFPNMKALADYVHSKGLKLGIYSSPGPKTCAGYEGSYQHEEIDARTWAEWGIDFLKYDWCSARRIWKIEEMPAIYKRMKDALDKTGRPILYSLCQYGWGGVWSWGSTVGGNLWRTTEDISADFESIAHRGFGQAGLERFAGPGHWNDPDMLEVGNGHLTPDENRFHMSLWSLLAAPLIAGNDLSSMKPEILEVLTNPEVIAVNQDPLGKQGYRVQEAGPVSVWAKPLADGSIAVGFFNTNEKPLPASVSFAQLRLKTAGSVRDLWSKKDAGTFTGKYETIVPGHGVVFVRIKSVKKQVSKSTPGN